VADHVRFVLFIVLEFVLFVFLGSMFAVLMMHAPAL
jgi:hypothetical protein